MKKYKNYILVSIAVLLLASCVKKYLPEDREILGDDSQFTETVYSPTLGRGSLYNTFNVGTSSSQPLTFKIVNMRSFLGEAAPELSDVFPVKVWKKEYTGEESSLQEIEDKRTEENHRLFEIREHSGQFVMWPEARSSFIKSRPDSGYVFDVEVSNSGGRRYFKNMRLMPYREAPYLPSNLDPVTGQSTNTQVYPARVSNVTGEKTNVYLGSGDIPVFFYKTGKGNSLTFKFLDTLQQPINPKKFAMTNWAQLVHGFDMKMTDSTVSYKVAYPIPLTGIKTRYTNTSGTMASTHFYWSRIGFGGIRYVSEIQFDFSIFEEGDWQIIFWFKNDNPKFTDG